MSDEKRKGDVVGPYAMNFAPFLEDIFRYGGGG